MVVVCSFTSLGVLKKEWLQCGWFDGLALGSAPQSQLHAIA